VNATDPWTPLNLTLVYGELSMSLIGAQLVFRTSVATTFLVLFACGGSPASQSSPSSAKDACTVAAVMIPVREALDTADTEATVGDNNGDLICASGIARITVLLGAISAPSDGPPGAPHLVLLEDDGGTWVVANDKLCSSTGQPTKPLPPQLGDVCGVQ
jgi:hypothetical protein